MKYAIETLEIERAKIIGTLRTLERNEHERLTSLKKDRDAYNSNLLEIEKAVGILRAPVQQTTKPMPKLPPAYIILDAVKASVPEQLTRREVGLIGNAYLAMEQQLIGHLE